jgi:hypothetical protein
VPVNPFMPQAPSLGDPGYESPFKMTGSETHPIFRDAAGTPWDFSGWNDATGEEWRRLSGIYGFPTGTWHPRADGGPVTKGQPYLVGERGPEFIIPNGNGTVLDAAVTKQLMRGRSGSASTTNNSTNLNGPMNVNVTTVGSTLDGVLNEVRQQRASLRMRRGQ